MAEGNLLRLAVAVPNQHWKTATVQRSPAIIARDSGFHLGRYPDDRHVLFTKVPLARAGNPHEVALGARGLS